MESTFQDLGCSRKRKKGSNVEETLEKWRKINSGSSEVMTGVKTPRKGPRRGCMKGKGGPDNSLCSFKGVRQKLSGKWVSEIRERGGGRGGNRLWLGTFPTAVEAARAYDKAAKAMYGTYAKLNLPDSYPHTTDHATSSSTCLASPSSSSANPQESNFLNTDHQTDTSGGFIMDSSATSLISSSSSAAHQQSNFFNTDQTDTSFGFLGSSTTCIVSSSSAAIQESSVFNSDQTDTSFGFLGSATFLESSSFATQESNTVSATELGQNVDIGDHLCDEFAPSDCSINVQPNNAPVAVEETNYSMNEVFDVDDFLTRLQNDDQDCDSLWNMDYLWEFD